MQSRRQGFTLVELLIVMLLGSLVLGAVYQTLISQQRSTRQTYAIIETQQNTRVGIELLASDLREISATDGDLLDASATSIRYRAMRKAGVVCAIVSGTEVDVVEIGEPFVANDSVYVFSDGANANSAIDDSWVRAGVQSVGTGSCTGHPIGTTIRRLTFSATIANVIRGAPVRGFNQVGYRILDQNSAGVLYRMQAGDSVAIIEDLRPAAQQGLRLRYWDTAGVAITSNLSSRLNEVGRVEVKLTGSMVGGGTGNNRQYTDSLVTTVFLRGNRKLR